MQIISGKLAIAANLTSIVILFIMILWVYISLIAGNVTPMNEHAVAICVTVLLPLALYCGMERCYGTDCTLPEHFSDMSNSMFRFRQPEAQ